MNRGLLDAAVEQGMVTSLVKELPPVRTSITTFGAPVWTRREVVLSIFGSLMLFDLD